MQGIELPACCLFQFNIPHSKSIRLSTDCWPDAFFYGKVCFCTNFILNITIKKPPKPPFLKIF